MLSSLRSLSLSRDSWPNYVRLEWEADDKEIRYPPSTHLIATVDELTDMLDFDSEDIDGMDDDAGEEQELPPTGRWTAPAEVVALKVFGRALKNTILRNIFWAPNCARFTICIVCFLGARL